MNKPILCVDDDPHLLEGLIRQFRTSFDLQTATSGQAALDMIRAGRVFGVIVSDLRMPGMDGVQLLSRCREICPESTRILLTGEADLEAAVVAVNQGRIFSFLTKPCPPETFREALTAGLEMNRLITVERELLRDTLTGSIRVITEVLAKVQPLAFGRGTRIRRFAKHVAAELSLPEAWQYELAAMFSHLGCLMLPAHVIEGLHDPASLTDQERKQLASHPAQGARLIQHIPRMEHIAGMIRYQNTDPTTLADKNPKLSEAVVVGARLLKLCLDLDVLMHKGLPLIAAVGWMKEQGGVYHPDMLKALATIKIDEAAELCVPAPA